LFFSTSLTALQHNHFFHRQVLPRPRITLCVASARAAPAPRQPTATPLSGSRAITAIALSLLTEQSTLRAWLAPRSDVLSLFCSKGWRGCLCVGLTDPWKACGRACGEACVWDLQPVAELVARLVCGTDSLWPSFWRGISSHLGGQRQLLGLVWVLVCGTDSLWPSMWQSISSHLGGQRQLLDAFPPPMRTSWHSTLCTTADTSLRCSILPHVFCVAE